ncbi:MAG: hypothetical protein QIT33_gp09 [Methanophagales virus PBV300]|uniref:Methyltransferase type 11 domain-containing protein n=1 Tax=Methanophagales virus PBV300 TaxID=2987731 RepID=A0ABY6GM21_9VIRU|nr:MAG: hypothetical protein QIT33_gp09 [Methanophagales virus PBV300]UYL64971.1 MAG: hypothetical protein JBCDKDKM_00009 [Methanophagales virus PBV300]
MTKIAYCQCTFARDVQRTLECVSLMSEHVDYVFIIADESVSPSQLELIGSNFDNVITKRVHFADDIPAFRNNYLELCEQYGIDWVLVSDPDEVFCHEFAKDLREIISDLEREGYNMAGINCREQFEAVEWLDELDLLKECPAGYRKSAFYKNLLFKMRKGLRYIGVGVGRVHETFNINEGWRVKLLPDKYYYVHRKSALDIWRNAARNMVIAGGGDNVGDVNPYWRKLRTLMQKYGVKSWMELERCIKEGEVPSEMVDFFIECLDAPRTNWGIETRQLAKFFLYYNRKYLTPDVLSKVREMPKQNKESAVKEFVTKCYFFLLGRHPDGAGLEHYSQKLLSGDMSEEDVAVSIAESAEFRERMSGLSVEDIVNRCYNLVLERNVDDSGLRTYGGMLRNGQMTVPQLLRTLFRSEEYAVRRKSNPQDRDAEFLRKWKRLLRIPLKVETGGKGIDKTPEEELRSKIERFRRHVPPQQFRKVLDLGAGDGLETLLLMQEGYDVVGITLGFDNLIRASEKYGVALYEMDMHNLQFADKSFDAIFCAQTFEHAFSAWLLVIEMRRVLRDGGRVFIEVPDPDNDELLNTIWHVNMLYPRQIIALFRKAGFKLVADLSKEAKYTLIFEKLPDGAFDTWGYVKYIVSD